MTRFHLLDKIKIPKTVYNGLTESLSNMVRPEGLSSDTDKNGCD